MAATDRNTADDDDRRTVKQMKDGERSLLPAINTTFDGIKKEVKKNLRKYYKAETRVLFDVDFWAAFLADLAKKPLSKIVETALQDAFRDMRINGALNDYEKEISGAVKNSTEKMVEGFDENEKELRRKMKQEIARNPLLKGDELLKRLDTITDNYFAGFRSRRIAQTTTTYANGTITTAAHVRNDFDSIWRHTGRGKTDRPSHVSADGQRRGNDGYFNVGGENIKHPGDGSAGNAINCHCVSRAAKRI